MVEFITQLNDDEFKDLLIALRQLKYRDVSHQTKLYEYSDRVDRRDVHLWDNGGSFKDNGEYYISMNDYETTVKEVNVYHNLYMVGKFGEKWLAQAQKYYEGNPEGLAVLNKATIMYEEMMQDAEEDFLDI